MITLILSASCVLFAFLYFLSFHQEIYNKESKTMQVAKHHLRCYLLQRGFPAAQHGSLKAGSPPA